MMNETRDAAPPVAGPAYVVAVATSAGGLRALSNLVEALPASFPSAVVVVQHLDPNHPSLVATILNRRSALPVREALDGERLRPGHVYVAPPDRHLLVNPDGTISLTRTALVHFVRPSADRLFESVAVSYKERAIAVVLTGSGSDGATGVRAIKEMGGTVLAQDAGSSEYFGMPDAAIQTGCVDYVLPLPEISPALEMLVGREKAG